MVDGNEQMIKLCWQYLEGMPVQKLANSDGGNLVIELKQFEDPDTVQLPPNKEQG